MRARAGCDVRGVGHAGAMATFDSHSDVTELPILQGPGGLAALGLWMRCGSWTASHGQTGVVPHAVAEEMSSGDQGAVQLLVDAGLWERLPEGYRMLRGPSSDPDLPLPLWRYSDDDLGGRLFSLDQTPNA